MVPACKSRSSHLILLLFLALALALGACNRETALPPRPSASPKSIYALVGVKHYYLALGDSLAFGYQPNGNFRNGYTAQWYLDLTRHGSRNLTNYGCAGETTQTFIHGGCVYAHYRHAQYRGSQLAAALDFMKQHAGQVSPVSLDIGADDLLPEYAPSSCTLGADFPQRLALVDRHLITIILPQLLHALTNRQGQRTGDLVLMSYYDPFANKCKDSVKFIEEINHHLIRDAAQFHVPVAKVFQAFGGGAVPNPNLCRDTWMCSGVNQLPHEVGIHPTTHGYHLIAQSFANLTGY